MACVTRVEISLMELTLILRLTMDDTRKSRCRLATYQRQPCPVERVRAPVVGMFKGKAEAVINGGNLDRLSLAAFVRLVAVG